MARIPQFSASRSLEVGGAVQYPSGSPVGAAVTGFGNTLQGVAERFKAMREKKDGFDAALIEDQLLADTQQMELDAERNAPADGNGLHDSVYGEIVPGPDGKEQVVKPGRFDELFDNYLSRVPESQREAFAAKKEVYRQRGSVRLGVAQYKAQQDYYKLEIEKSQNNVINAITLMDPNDNATFETYKRNVLELIDKSDLPAIERDIAKANWEANAEIALAESFIANDPDGPEKVRGWLGFKAEEDASGGTAAGAAASLLRKFEGFSSGTYWDVNAHRVGYGSDTITKADGSVVRVRKGDTVSRDDAERDLARRSQEFADLAASKVGATWGSLPENARAALTSITYNYGRLPANVAAAAQTGDVEKIATAVEALKGHNGGVNSKRRQEEANIIRGTSSVPSSGPQTVDPRFSSMTAAQRQAVANKAAVVADKNMKDKIASDNADYGQYKDAIELQIVRGDIKDEELVFNDPRLKAGDKASLIRSLRTQNEGANQIAADLSALASNSLSLDPYGTKDKTRADNLYTDMTKRVQPEQYGAVAGAIVEQTGVVPQPVVNLMRKGFDSDNPTEVVASAQLAQRFAVVDPAALGRRDGGEAVQTKADMFSYYTNSVGLTNEEAARRIIDDRNPEKVRARDALIKSEETKKFIKNAATEASVRDIFDPGIFGVDPKLGDNPAQAAAMVGEYRSILEESLFDANGDQAAAKELAAKRFARIYRPSEFTFNSGVVMRVPPEATYPVGRDGTHGYVRQQATDALKEQGIEADKIYLQPYEDTEADRRAGKPARYQLWYEKDGEIEMFNYPFSASPEAPISLDENRARWEQNVANPGGGSQKPSASRYIKEGIGAAQELLRRGGEGAPQPNRDTSLDNFLDGDPLKGGN